MTIFHFGGKPDKEFIEAPPDPTWGYSHIWRNLSHLVHSSRELKQFVAGIEERSDESDQLLKDKLLLLQGEIIQILNGLEPEG